MSRPCSRCDASEKQRTVRRAQRSRKLEQHRHGLVAEREGCWRLDAPLFQVTGCVLRPEMHRSGACARAAPTGLPLSVEFGPVSPVLVLSTGTLVPRSARIHYFG